MESKRLEIEKILSKRRVGDHYIYLIQWKDNLNPEWVSVERLYENIEKVWEYEANIRDKIDLGNMQTTKKFKFKNKRIKMISNNLEELNNKINNSNLFQEEGDINNYIPIRIINAWLQPDNSILLLVEWKERNNENNLKSSYVTNDEMKTHYPVLLA